MEQNKQQELQNILVQLEMYKKGIDDITRETRLLDLTISETQSAISALSVLKETKVGSEVLLPIGQSVFMRAKLKENKTVIMGVGADVLVEKEAINAVEDLKVKIEELNKRRTELQKNVADIETRAIQLNQMAENLAMEIQGGQ